MARLHSKRKGKSSTKRPKAVEKATFVKESNDEITSNVRNLSTRGVKPAIIGAELRDKHGIPSFRAQTGKKLLRFLKEENVYKGFPPDLLDLLRKAVKMAEHIKANKKDTSNKVKLKHTESKILRLLRYYKKTGKVPKDWNYSAERAALLVR